eukprot:g4964.t1
MKPLKAAGGQKLVTVKLEGEADPGSVQLEEGTGEPLECGPSAGATLAARESQQTPRTPSQTRPEAKKEKPALATADGWAARVSPDCLGITQISEREFVLRVSEDLCFSDSGETSWVWLTSPAWPKDGIEFDFKYEDVLKTYESGERGPDDRKDLLQPAPEDLLRAEEKREVALADERRRVANFGNQLEQELMAYRGMALSQEVYVESEVRCVAGTYSLSGEKNGCPVYKKKGSTEAIFFDGFQWVAKAEFEDIKQPLIFGPETRVLSDGAPGSSSVRNPIQLGAWPNGKGTRIFDAEWYNSPNELEGDKFVDPGFKPVPASIYGETRGGQTDGAAPPPVPEPEAPPAENDPAGEDAAAGAASSPTGNEGKAELQFGDDIDWERACNLQRGRKMRMFAAIEPNDVARGALGNTWLLGALAAVAEFPGYLEENVFRNHLGSDLSPTSRYELRLYDLNAPAGGESPLDEAATAPNARGSWVTVVVDDLVPAHEGRALFSKPTANHNEIWLCLVEKAFAKKLGSYAALTRGDGNLALGWQSLVANAKCHRFVKSKYMWDCGLGKGLDNNELWDSLKQWDKANFIIAVGLPHKRWASYRTDGLLQGYSYNVLATHEVKDRSGREVRAVLLRNPWGRASWTGTFWSVFKDCEPDALLEAGIGRENAEDGLFYMKFDMDERSFVNVWSAVCLCAVTMPVRRRGCGGNLLTRFLGGEAGRGSSVPKMEWAKSADDDEVKTRSAGILPEKDDTTRKKKGICCFG